MQDLQTENKGQILAVKDLPTLPKVLQEVSKLVEDESSSPEQIAKVISKDQVLSAKVLRMVNSPIYGFPRRINTVQHALVLLGLNVINGLIISTSVFEIMTKSMVGLWEHSLGCALCCSSLASEAGFKDPEEYAVTGLLHDIGKVVEAVQLPEAKAEVERRVAEEDLSYLEAEKKELGFGHDRVNAWLADHWNLPLNIREGLAYHHRPLSAQFYPNTAHVVHIGDFLVRSLDIGNGGDDQLPYLQPGSLQALGLELSSLERVLDQVGQEAVDLDSLDFGS
ncbi:MAG: HDOD domain-containing protein [Desulfohalobiaceae bacterium]